jgi:hypothetical protein
MDRSLSYAQYIWRYPQFNSRGNASNADSRPCQSDVQSWNRFEILDESKPLES